MPPRLLRVLHTRGTAKKRRRPYGDSALSDMSFLLAGFLLLGGFLSAENLAEE